MASRPPNTYFAPLTHSAHGVMSYQYLPSQQNDKIPNSQESKLTTNNTIQHIRDLHKYRIGCCLRSISPITPSMENTPMTVEIAGVSPNKNTPVSCEADHRIANHLAILSSLLHLQAQQVSKKNGKRGKTSGDRGGAARVRAFSGRLTNRLSRRRFCAGQPAAQRVLTRAGRLGTSIALGTLSLAPR